MTTIPSLSDVTDILDTDLVMVTNAQGQSYKIAGSELNKRHKVIIASSTTVTGTPLKAGWPVRICFTVDITAANATTTMQINYNNVNYYVKVPKNGALANYVAFNLGGSPAVFKYVQAYTTLELLFDGTQFIIMCNPVVISGTNFSIYADGLKRVDEVTENGTDLVTSHAVAAAIDKVKDIMASLPTDAVLHYSFDDVPDYPDGTAVYKRDNDWVNSDNWNSDYGNTTFSVSNGIAKWTVTNGSTIQLSKVIQNSVNKIIKMRIKCSEAGIVFRVVGNENSSFKSLAIVTTKGTWQDIVCYKPSTYNMQIVLIAQNNNENTSLEISQFYVGDGTYSTPIIDNANGQFNAENNGLLPQQGMSGKGTVSFDKYTYAKNTNFKLRPPYSYSLWIKINSEITGTQYLLDGRNGSVNTADEGIIITPAKAITVGIANSDVTSNSNVVPLNEWFHIVVTCNDEETGSRYKVYINGSLINSGLTSSKSTGFEQLVVNARYADVSNYAKSGRQLDDLLIFDRALTENEVMALYLNKANTPKYYPPAQLPS